MGQYCRETRTGRERMEGMREDKFGGKSLGRRKKEKKGRHGGHKEWTVSDLIHCRGLLLWELVVGDRDRRAADTQLPGRWENGPILGFG